MKILVTGAWKCTQEQQEQLEARGHEIIKMSHEYAELPCAYEKIEGAICNGLFLHHPIEKFTSLKYIQLTSAGFDRVPMEYIEKKGIEIHNARGVYSIPMAEFAVGGVLQLYKQSSYFYKNQMKQKWEKHRGLMEVCGKTVCIVGCGSVGNECAKRFGAFGCKIIGVDLYPREDVAYKKILSIEKLKEGILISDIVVLTLPLTKKTQHIMSRDIFETMKEGAVLVNIARGGVVDEQALQKVLKTKLHGAVLDVFEEEPLPKESELWQMENVIITPHNSFVGEGNNGRLSDVIFSNLK